MTFQQKALPQLPYSWVWTEVEKVCDVQTGPFGTQLHRNDYTNSGINTIEIGDVHPNRNLAEGTAHFVSGEKAKQLSRFEVREGDILFTRVGTVGRCTKVPATCNRWLMSTSLIRVRPSIKEPFLSSFLLYYFWSPIAQSFAKATSKGTTRAGTNSKIVEKLPLALAPINEQIRIVTKIEELFSFLDAGVTSFRMVKAQLKRYRQAVLKHAFEGKLTQQWREMHSQSIIEKQPNNDLPSGWALTRLVDIAEVKMGQSPFGSSCGSNPAGYPLLNGPTEFGPVHPTPRQWTTKPTRICKKGDLLICVRGNTTGRMNWADQEYCIGRGLAALSVLGNDADLFFIYYFLLKEVNEIMRRTTGSTFPNLKSDELKNFELPIAPFEEQKAIVQKIETLLSVAGQTEEDLHTVLVQTNHLRQGILMNTFEGKLVPQVPADEPAECLLERIKAERLTNKSRNNQVELSEYVK